MRDHKTFNDYFASSSDAYAKCLLEIKELFDKGRYSEGKIIWLTLFPGRFDTNLPVLDLWGNKEDFFTSRLQPAITTSY